MTMVGLTAPPQTPTVVVAEFGCKSSMNQKENELLRITVVKKGKRYQDVSYGEKLIVLEIFSK